MAVSVWVPCPVFPPAAVFGDAASAPQDFCLRLILFPLPLMELMGTFVSYCPKLKLYGRAPLSLIYWPDNGPVAPGDG